MKLITSVLGIVLKRILGILALVYQGFDYTRQETVVNIGPLSRHGGYAKTRPYSTHRRGIGFGSRRYLDRHRCDEKGVAGTARGALCVCSLLYIRLGS